MKFFEVVPSELFSPLASPNRILYADALDVLYAAYQENLKIREDVLYSMLRGRLEQELADATFEDEDIDEEELRDISGRARFLIRKLCSKGWFEKERGDDFEEYITIPNYSSRLLELFHQLRDDSPARGYSYVFGTFSVLKTADDSNNAYDKMTALYSAYDNTTALISLLQMVYHNVKHYFQTQIDMQDVNQVLAAHFNDFGQKVVEAYIRPLKIKDSVPKYRVPIQSILRRWEEDDALLMTMANEALRDKRGKTLENCRADLLRKIFWIEERYDNLEKDYLEEIEILENDVMVHITYIESQPESNPTIVGHSKKYQGIGRVLIAYGIKLSIDHECGGTVTFEAKVPELAEHYVRDYGACPLPSFGGAPRYELSGEAAMNIFVTYLK